MCKKCRPLYCVCGCTLPQRFVVAILCVLGVVVGYGQRASLNIAITRMVSLKIRNLSNECPLQNGSVLDENIKGGTYDWSETIQGWLLQGFFVGYFLGTIPAGICADKLGGKWTYLGGTIIACMLSIITPMAIKYTEWYWVYVVRILLGIFQGVIYPAMSVLVAHWIPASERATIGGFCFSSNALGTVLGNLFTGLIISYTRFWPNAFYFWAGIGLVWCVFFYFYIFDTPTKHPHITEKEMELLMKEMPHPSKFKVPWKGILLDKGILALMIGQIGHDFTFYMMITNMPKYFSDVLHMRVRDIALVTSIPFLGIWLTSILSGEIIDHGIKKRHWNVKWSRTVATYISFVIPNSLLCVMVYMECKLVPSTLCYAVACVFKGPHFSGFKVNHMDITVNFNGIIMSMINTCGTIGGFLSPLIVSYVAPRNKLSEWKTVIWIYFGLAFFFTTYYLFMAHARRAQWDVPTEELDNFRKAEEEIDAAEDEWKAHKAEEKEARRAAREEAASIKSAMSGRSTRSGRSTKSGKKMDEE